MEVNALCSHATFLTVLIVFNLQYVMSVKLALISFKAYVPIIQPIAQYLIACPVQITIAHHVYRGTY